MKVFIALRLNEFTKLAFTLKTSGSKSEPGGVPQGGWTVKIEVHGHAHHTEAFWWEQPRVSKLWRRRVIPLSTEEGRDTDVQSPSGDRKPCGVGTQQ